MNWGSNKILLTVGVALLGLLSSQTWAVGHPSAPPLTSGLRDPVVDSCMAAMPSVPPQFADQITEMNRSLAGACVQQQLFGALFGAAQGAGVGGQQSGGGLGQSCTNVMTGGSFIMGSFSLETPCPGSANQSFAPSCEDVGGEGSFDATAFQALQATNQASLQGACCKMAKMNLVDQNVQCLQNQARALTQQMSAMQTTFQAEIQARAQCRDQVNERVIDRQAQVQEIETLLGGEGGAGAPGLVALRDQLKEAVQRMPAEIREIETKQRALIEARRGFEEQIQERTSEQAMACFTTAENALETYRCDGGQRREGETAQQGGVPVSAMDFAQCIYRQRSQYDSSGRLQRGAGASNAADSQSAGLGPLLQQIAQDASGGTGILSVADLDARYGSRLARYRAPGFDVRQFVISRMGACYTRADRRIRRDVRRSSGELGQAKAALEEREAEVRADANTKLLQYQNMYSDAFMGLTGEPAPLNLAACRRSRTQGQINCISQLRDNLIGVLNGTQAASGVDMRISGRRTSRSGADIQFRCAGLNGCIRTLQTVRRNVKRREMELQRNLLARTQQFSRSTENFVTNASQALQSQSSLIRQRVDKINGALAAMGLSPMDINTVQATPLAPDGGQPPLPAVPQDMAGLIGSRMTPPMLDISDSQYQTGARQSIADGRSEINQEFQAANQTARAINALPARCAGRQNRDLAQNAIRAISNCSMAQEACGDPNNNRIDELRSVISGINPSAPGLSGGRLTSLDRGINGMCDGYDAVADGGADARLSRSCKNSLEGALTSLNSRYSAECSGLSSAERRANPVIISIPQPNERCGVTGLEPEVRSCSLVAAQQDILRSRKEYFENQIIDNGGGGRIGQGYGGGGHGSGGYGRGRTGQRFSRGCSIAEIEDNIYQLRDSSQSSGRRALAGE